MVGSLLLFSTTIRLSHVFGIGLFLFTTLASKPIISSKAAPVPVLPPPKKQSTRRTPKPPPSVAPIFSSPSCSCKPVFVPHHLHRRGHLNRLIHFITKSAPTHTHTPCKRSNSKSPRAPQKPRATNRNPRSPRTRSFVTVLWWMVVV